MNRRVGQTRVKDERITESERKQTVKEGRRRGEGNTDGIVLSSCLFFLPSFRDLLPATVKRCKHKDRALSLSISHSLSLRSLSIYINQTVSLPSLSLSLSLSHTLSGPSISHPLYLTSSLSLSNTFSLSSLSPTSLSLFTAELLCSSQTLTPSSPPVVRREDRRSTFHLR